MVRTDFSRWSLGFDNLFNDLWSYTELKIPNYPPYNISKNDNKTVLDIAVAGFKKDDVKVTTLDRGDSIELKINGGKPNVKNNGNVLHQGIAKRDFELKFKMNTSTKIESVTMSDGILSITCVTEKSSDGVQEYEIK